MVICKVKDKLKLVLLFAQYLTEWVKMTVIFISCDSFGLSILPGSYQTQRRDSAVRPHLLESIIAFISINYRSRERERERERDDSCVYLLAASVVSLSTSNYFKTAILSPRCWRI